MSKETYEKLQKELEHIEDIPFEAAAEFERKQEILLHEVNRIMEERRDILRLIGENPLKLAEDNHRNHGKFMVNVFKLNRKKLLLDTLPWVYRTYRSQGFSYEYFLLHLQAWSEAINKYLEPHLASYLQKVYRWMMDRHHTIIELSRQKEEDRSLQTIEETWKTVFESFLSALLKGDHQECLRLADQKVNSREELEGFYLQVLQPILYHIGYKWEKGEISVAHEHLASAIVSRVMASLYPRFVLVQEEKGKAVITASPNEFHEIGARMVADFLELDGWDVKYLGSNTPPKDLLQILREDPPEILGISVAMPFNIDTTIDLIQYIKSDVEVLTRAKILVGGKVFSENPQLWEATGADGWASHGKEAVNIASRWWESENCC